MHKANVLSPPLDASIYTEQAVDNAAAEAREQFQARCLKLNCERGWRISIESIGEFSGSPSELLDKILNRALIRSLESRLERVKP